MIDGLTTSDLVEMKTFFEGMAARWSDLQDAIAANRISDSAMIRRVIEDGIYALDFEILVLIVQNRARSPTFRALVLETLVKNTY